MIWTTASYPWRAAAIGDGWESLWECLGHVLPAFRGSVRKFPNANRGARLRCAPSMLRAAPRREHSAPGREPSFPTGAMQ